MCALLYFVIFYGIKLILFSRPSNSLSCCTAETVTAFMFRKNSLIFCSPPVVESYHSRNLNIGQCWQGGTTVTFCGWSYSNIFKQTLVINQFSRCPWHISVVRIIYLTSEIRLDKIGFNIRMGSDHMSLRFTRRE